MRIGSLFSGAGGLDRAVEQVFGAATAWHCEVDPAASKVLAHRWPGVPNLGDITQVDWAAVEPVDILCGGYPCQPFSAAGQRKGSNDERHLWPYFAQAIRHLRPAVAYHNVSATQWGKYEPAIRRWEALTRPAPSPTEPNTKGNPRLAAAFSEWMLGWPAGWVTAVPGISRNDALRIVGNGVVPQCAAAALRWLLTVSAQAA